MSPRRRVASAFAAVLILSVSLFGCSSGDAEKARPKPTAPSAPAATETSVPRTDAERIEEVYERFESAYVDARWDDVCALLTPAFQVRTTRFVRKMFPKRATCSFAFQVNAPDEKEQREGLSTELEAIEVIGNKATGRIRRDTWRFEKQHGEWLIAYLD